MSAKEIWDTLSGIDVSSHVDKKGNLSYLSWAWAWGTLMKHYPQAIYNFLKTERHDDGTCTVYCEVIIDEVSRLMWLPVMDHRNNAIKDPDARKISDTKMRCLTKCLAMFGLGHYIYAGEDLPEKPAWNHNYSEEEKRIFDYLMKEGNAIGMYVFSKGFNTQDASSPSADAWVGLTNSFERGTKGRENEKLKKLMKDGESAIDCIVIEIKECVTKGDDVGVKENLEDLKPTIKEFIKNQLTTEEVLFLKEIGE
ncbi:MAG: hypothetical protein CMI54_04790 [Parcubacteria group bacterium]|nr:hypothetical protein [Parcubacteria group bacterium]|tara:strand:- start:32363 stop:33121 length:759 start_codon:yes stop_codon:yes gene_type:complete